MKGFNAEYKIKGDEDSDGDTEELLPYLLQGHILL